MEGGWLVRAQGSGVHICSGELGVTPGHDSGHHTGIVTSWERPSSPDPLSSLQESPGVPRIGLQGPAFLEGNPCGPRSDLQPGALGSGVSCGGCWWELRSWQDAWLLQA